MDKFPKFILFEGSLIISKVKYHKDILCDIINLEIEKDKIKGGGWFRFVSSSNTFIFNGNSQDFGKATIEDIKQAIDDGLVFTNISRTNSIADSHNFSYDIGGGEIIQLKQL